MDEWDAALAGWSAEDRVLARARERSLRRQLTESADLAGVMRHLSEQREEAVVRLRAGGLLRGMVTALGRDFACIDGMAYIPFVAIAAIGCPPGPAATVDAGTFPTFAATMARLAEDRPSVRVTLDGGDTMTGELQAVGEDVLVLSTGYAVIGAIAALTLV